MSFEFADNITSIVLNAVMTLALAGLLLLLGRFLNRRGGCLRRHFARRDRYRDVVDDTTDGGPEVLIEIILVVGGRREVARQALK